MSKTVIYEFWYDYLKTNYGEKEKLWTVLCRHRQFYHVHKNRWYLSKRLKKMLKQGFKLQLRAWKATTKGKEQNFVMKDKSGRKIMKKIVVLSAKYYIYWRDDGSELINWLWNKSYVNLVKKLLFSRWSRHKSRAIISYNLYKTLCSSRNFINWR